MNPGALDERTLVEYLLGRLPEPERTHIDERLFAEDALEEELRATADDLIHAYLEGSLSAEDRGRFEAHFLAVPGHQQRLAFIRDLGSAVELVSLQDGGKKADRLPVAIPSWQQLWPTAATLILLIGGMLFVLTRPMRKQQTVVTGPSPSPSLSAVLRDPTLSAALPRSTPQGPKIRVVRLPRGSGPSVRVPLSDSTRHVRIEVAVPEGPPSFDAVLRGVDGTEAWRTESLPPPRSGRRLVFNVPAEVLRGDAYTLRIEGEPLRDAAPPVLEYRVRVVRER